MAQSSEFFDDIFHFYRFYSEAFLRLNLFVTALMMKFAIIIGNGDFKTMQTIGS